MKSRQLEELNQFMQDTKIRTFQEYIDKVLTIRGFSNQRCQEKLLLLMEEVGELAKAIRKHESVLGIDYSKINNFDTVENEIADVFIVLISLANVLKIDVVKAIYEKEIINIDREWK